MYSSRKDEREEPRKTWWGYVLLEHLQALPILIVNMSNASVTASKRCELPLVSSVPALVAEGLAL